MKYLNDLNDVPAKHDHGAERSRTMNHHAESQPASSTPSSALPISRCPELLTGRNSAGLNQAEKKSFQRPHQAASSAAGKRLRML